jgi:Fe2+ or Zn2+ uptake regulation protein
MSSNSELKEQIKAAGLRVTAPRLAVFAAVASKPHQNTEEIVKAASKRAGSMSIQAVYDNLQALVSAGLVRRIQPAGSAARYETRVDDNHHHVVCRKCGASADVDCAVNFTPCLTASDDNGFIIDEAEVIYWGICPKCQKNKKL